MPHENHETNQEKLQSLLARLLIRGTRRQFTLLFEKYHEADIADALAELEDDIGHAFFQSITRIPFDKLTDVFENLSTNKQARLIQLFDRPLSLHLLRELSSDDSAKLFGELYEENDSLADSLMAALPKADSDVLKEMILGKDTAGGMMNTDFISIPENLTVRQALDYFRAHDPAEEEMSFYIFIVDDEQRLVGCTNLRNLILAELDSPVKDIRDDYPTRAVSSMDREEVASMFERYDLVVLPVVDEMDVLEGIITVDDIVDVVIEEATEDLYKLSGTGGDFEEEKLITGPIYYPIMSRLPWLIVTVLGGVLASILIASYSKIYEPTHYSLAISLSFVPLLMGLGGVVGNQSSTIIVRGISTGLVKESHAWRVLLREILVGISMGSMVGGTFFFVSLLLGNSMLISGIVSAALVANVSVAAILGVALPILFKKRNIDPAIASAPFISTTLDITGQLIYFAITLVTFSLLVGL